MKTLYSATVFLVLAIVAPIGLSSCTITRTPEGAWVATPDPGSVLIISNAAAGKIVEASK